MRKNAAQIPGGCSPELNRAFQSPAIMILGNYAEKR